MKRCKEASTTTIRCQRALLLDRSTNDRNQHCWRRANRRRHCRVVTTACLWIPPLLLAWLPLCSSSSSSSSAPRVVDAVSLFDRQPSSRSSRGFSSLALRGGDAKSDFDDDEAAELDAYIEQLLHEVDDDDPKKQATPATATATQEVTEKTRPVTTKDAAVVQESKRKKAKDPASPSSTSPTLQKKRSATSKKAEISTQKNKAKNSLAKQAPKKTIITTSKLESSSETETEDSSSLNHTLDNSPSHANITSSKPVNVTTQSTTHNSHNMEPRRPPLPPPNGFYRFLLRRANGFGGRSLVLVMVTASEFLHTYIPPMAKAGDWVWYKVFSPTKGGGSAARRRGSARPSVNAAASISSRMARTGVSRSKRRKFTQQADQQALAQLKQRPTASELRYTFCSVAFCQRHGLGKWASSSADKKAMTPADADAIYPDRDSISLDDAQGVLSVQGQKKKVVKKKKQDWVLAALTKEPPRHKTTPTLVLQAGSGGLTLGVELDWSSRKERVRAALTLSPKKAKSVSRTPSSKVSPRKSDADGGVLGRLRTAAGSSMARSLSGAYPGDALGVNEASSPLGLSDFAAKYGYGDWSESDNAMDNAVGAKRRRRKSRHGKKTRNESLDSDFDPPNTGLSSTKRSSRRSPRSLSPEIALSSSSTLRRRETFMTKEKLKQRTKESLDQRPGSSARSVAPRRVEMAKPALSRTHELRRKKSTHKHDDE